MMSSKLIIVTGMSGAGKSTTAQNIAWTLAHHGQPHIWLHEECAHHPIRAGEFPHGVTCPEDKMQENVEDLLERWRRLVEQVKQAPQVFVMEGCLYQNIIRYFLDAGFSENRILGFYDKLMQILAPLQPTIVFLARRNVAKTLQAVFPIRGQWWQDLILDDQNPYLKANGLRGAAGVYAMWEEYQRLSHAAFDRYNGRKIKVYTDEETWEANLTRIMHYLGWSYHPMPTSSAEDLAPYYGRYETEEAGQTHSLEIAHDENGLYCRAFWSYMKLLPLGPHRFMFVSFPIQLTFVLDSVGIVSAVDVSGNYDWEIVGKRLVRI